VLLLAYFTDLKQLTKEFFGDYNKSEDLWSLHLTDFHLWGAALYLVQRVRSRTLDNFKAVITALNQSTSGAQVTTELKIIQHFKK